MVATLSRTFLAIENCEEHLNALDEGVPEVEFYMTQYLLVRLCADVQQELYLMLDQRANLSGDERISNFVSETGRRVIRSVSKADIATFVGYFGKEEKDKLNATLDSNEVRLYGDAIDKRHDVAHKHGAQITFQDLKNAASAARNIIAKARDALGLPPV